MSQSNIAFFVTSLNSGGIENYLLRFLQFKAKDFNEITVFCKSGQAGQLEDKYKAIPNVKIHLKSISFFNLQDYLYLYNFLKKNQIDAVCDFTGNFAVLTLLTAKRAGINKRITWYRNAEEKFKRTPLRLLYNKIINTITYQTTTKILSNSIAALNHFYKGYNWQSDARFQVIYNGVKAEDFMNISGSLREEFNIPADAFVIGHVGRYNEQKNHDTIIQVAFELCAKHPNFYFILCGKGVAEVYENRVEEKSLKDKIIITGVRSDIPQVLNSCDCFLFPSTIEGNPNALIEAMISGLPIIASNIGPIKEATPQEAHANLIDPYDTKAFIEHIENIYNCKNLASSLIYQNWAIKAFDYKERFEEFYKVIQ